MKLNIKAVWLSPPATFILGWSVKRRGYHVMCSPYPTEWRVLPGWSFTLWLGLWNVNLETSDARPTLSD